MWSKRILLLLIIVLAYVHIMVNNPDDRIKSIGYKQLLNFYAARVNYNEHIELVHNSGLRKLSVPKEEIEITAVLPDDDNYEQIANKLLKNEGFVLTQCSAMDSWNTSETGRYFLDKMYHKGYRAVVFDGGHHLPTLGLVPDIIIVPQMAGYAVHSYMRDGMKIEKLLSLLEDIKSPAIIAVLPRWALIKQENALKSITKTVITKTGYRKESNQGFTVTAHNRMSKYNNTILIYINSHYYNERRFLLKNIKLLGINDVQKIYLAFDYNSINKLQAAAFAHWLSENLSIEVETVNEPVNVFNAFWGGK